MQFDKLYNLILESILTEDIQSKIRKAIQTLIKSGQLKGEDDPKAQLVKIIIKRNNSIDVNGKTKLSQFLKQNQTYTKRAEAKKISYLDKIPEFSQKKQYPNGVVIYRVDESRAGMMAVRKIVDIQWGTSSNPWCLIARQSYAEDEEEQMENAWNMWNNYNAYPKAIAFQNGKLLAFCANNQHQTLWWDRKDKFSKELKLLDGTTMTTDNYKWSKEELFKKFLSKNKLVLNKKTGLYDSNVTVRISNGDLIDGHLPIPFGRIDGDFWCSGCKELKDLTNGPTRVQKIFSISYCDGLKNLIGAPEYVGGDFDCYNCKNLTSLQGAPKEVHGYFRCYQCSKLTSLQGAPKRVNGNFYCYSCLSLKSLEGAPKYVGRDFDCQYNSNLTSLKGSPIKVGGSFNCSNCKRLISLKGITPNIDGNINISSCGITKLEYLPKIVNGNFDCSENFKLRSLEGSPEVVKGNFYCDFTKISSFLGGPKIVKGNIACYNCDDLVSLNGLPQKVTGNISCLFCNKLKVTEQDRKKYKVKNQ